jgi:hypothetical protein
MLVAIAAGLVPLAWTLPLIHQAQVLAGDMVVRSTNFFAKPAPSDLLGYMQMFAFPMIIIGVFVFLIWPKRVSCIDAVDLPRVYGFEWAAAGALCLVLPAQILVAELLTNYSLPRYSVSASLGLALLGGWAIPRISPLRKYSQIVLALSMGTFLLISTLFFLKTQIHKKVWSAKPYKGWASSLLARAPGDLPIVVSNAYDYAPDWWYSSRAIQGRIIYLSDLPYAVQQADFLPEFGLVKGQEFLPMPVSDYARFLQNHGQFLLLVSGAPRLNWLPARLTSAGWHLETVTTSEDDVLYRVTKP